MGTIALGCRREPRALVPAGLSGSPVHDQISHLPFLPSGFSWESDSACRKHRGSGEGLPAGGPLSLMGQWPEAQLQPHTPISLPLFLFHLQGITQGLGISPWLLVWLFALCLIHPPLLSIPTGQCLLHLRTLMQGLQRTELSLPSLYPPDIQKQKLVGKWGTERPNLGLIILGAVLLPTSLEEVGSPLLSPVPTSANPRLSLRSSEKQT